MILLTGVAGFIGFHTAKALLEQGEKVIGIDNLNDYYDPALKQGRLEKLEPYKDLFTFYKTDIADQKAIETILQKHPDITQITHLAAQAGVRYSIRNPQDYTKSNLIGHMVMLEAARQLHDQGQLNHFIYASSSSIYGGNTKKPFSVDDQVNNPVSLYAATKRSCELLTQSYSHLYRVPSTGLRLFTVYGTWGRPDMAYYYFTKNILEGKPIKVYNHGNMRRDFTWIEDIVDGILGALERPPAETSKYIIGASPHRIFNLGNNKSEKLLDFIEIIEESLGKKAKKEMHDMAPGDVQETYADIDTAKEVFGYNPQTPISEGIPKFVEWYQSRN